jgi:hypothetical protein
MKDPMLGSITGIGVNWSNRAGTISPILPFDQGCKILRSRSCTGDVWRQVDRSVEIDESEAARALLWAITDVVLVRMSTRFIVPPAQ